MLILALDTSTRNCSLAVLRDGEVLAASGGVSEEPYASRVFSDADRLLAQAGLELAQIELFAVVAGPGSFTGLRVGLAAVKGWAEILGRPIAPVSGLDAVAAQAQGIARVLAAVIDARGGQVFGGVFRKTDTDGQLIAMAEEVALGSDDYFQWVAGVAGGERPLFVTTTPDAVKAGLANSAFASATLEVVPGELAPTVGRLGLACYRRGEVADALSLDANYVRRSDAEVKWRGG